MQNRTASKPKKQPKQRAKLLRKKTPPKIKLTPNDARLRELERSGEFEPPPPGVRPSFEPIVDTPVPDGLQRFLAERR